MEDEANNPEQGSRTTFDQLIDKARVAKATAEPHIRSLAQQAKHAADVAQQKAAEYQPEIEKQIRAGANKARDALEAAKPRLAHLVEEARPRVEKAAQDVAVYVDEHQDELREAAQLMTPTALRPIFWKVTETNTRAEREENPTHQSATQGAGGIQPPRAIVCVRTRTQATNRVFPKRVGGKSG